MKAYIIGHGRHGKDTVGEILRDNFGMSFQSSSWIAGESVVRPYLADRGLEYDTMEECYEDRHNHREAWYQAILEFNDPLTRLSELIFSQNDLYVGIRDRGEFLASKHMSDIAIWVEAWERKPEPDPTCKVLRGDCDIIIDNNGTEQDLYDRVMRLGACLV